MMHYVRWEARRAVTVERGIHLFYTEVDGLSVAYERTGSGPAIVLLHGFTQDSQVWRPQLDGLSDRHAVIAWDAPGAGRSADPPETFGLVDWAHCLARFLDAIGVPRAHLLGLSWGGILAQEFYRHYPKRVLSLILADTYAGWKGSLPEPIPRERLESCLRDASLLPADFVPKYLAGMFGESPAPETQELLASIMSDFHPIGFRLMAISSAQADTRDLLQHIKVPTLLVWGEADKRSPINIAFQFLQAIPSAKLSVFSGVGHVSNLEAPDRFNAEVLGFCSAIASA